MKEAKTGKLVKPCLQNGLRHGSRMRHGRERRAVAITNRQDSSPWDIGSHGLVH